MNKLKRFFWLCSGANRHILEKCPTEGSKYAGIGATIFFTGVFAALAGAYSLYTVFENYIVSVIFGIVWGLMIFNLDRYIVSSMRKEGNSKKRIVRYSKGLRTRRIFILYTRTIVIVKKMSMYPG